MDANKLGLLLIAVAASMFGARLYFRERALVAAARFAGALLLIELAAIVLVFLSAFLQGWTGGIGA